MFRNVNTNHTASLVAERNKSRTVLNNSINNRTDPIGPNQNKDTNISLLKSEGTSFIYPTEPIVQNDVISILQSRKNARFPEFPEQNLTTFVTPFTLIYSNISGATQTVSYSVLISPSNSGERSIIDNSSANLIVTLSNLQVNTLYSAQLNAINNYGTRFITLPEIQTLIPLPTFPVSQSITQASLFDSITYTNISVSPYADYNLYTISPTDTNYSIRSNINNINSIDLFIYGLNCNTSYSPILYATNEYDSCNYNLPTIATTNIAAPTFPGFINGPTSRTTTSITYTNITGATNVNDVSQYYVTLDVGNCNITNFTANINVLFNFGAQCNVDLQINGLNPLITYTPTLWASNSIGNSSNILNTITTNATLPEFPTGLSGTVTITPTSFTINNWPGANSINSSDQYSVIVQTNSGGNVNRYTITNKNLIYNAPGTTSNVTFKINNLSKNTLYKIILIASNIYGRASNVFNRRTNDIN